MPQVLVVDDNPLSLLFFSEVLASTGITCTTADDGAQAIAFADTCAFDLLLIDARMPGLDGTQTLHVIRAGGGASRNTVAIATTAADASAHERLLAAGFAEVIAKPITLAALHEVIARHVARPPAAAASEHMPTLLDDNVAMAAAGHDGTIVAALRGLLAGELDALPGEFGRLMQTGEFAGMHDRLHRLAASAGFCGATHLASAVDRLRTALESGPPAAATEIDRFLVTCAQTRALLGETATELLAKPSSAPTH